ncbi:hypothetical protein AVEN_18154-1 [Araneus ventricosus]|uniref:Uncharacterized protein n=1 Tax=Araneus ventricosus TaxID=182803 RepID=A0A4Y2AIH4_ARAVE|nr:hypothetical protein AVEN_18154-1 [Araneus ventricosus]
MAVQPKLHLSPFVLSTVMFDNSNSVGDQEGFLIGNAQKCVRREISDQSMFNTEEDLIIMSSETTKDAMPAFSGICIIAQMQILNTVQRRKSGIVGTSAIPDLG